MCVGAGGGGVREGAVVWLFPTYNKLQAHVHHQNKKCTIFRAVVPLQSGRSLSIVCGLLPLVKSMERAAAMEAMQQFTNTHPTPTPTPHSTHPAPNDRSKGTGLSVDQPVQKEGQSGVLSLRF